MDDPKQHFETEHNNPMADPNDRLNQLNARLDALLNAHNNFVKEIHALKNEIIALKNIERKESLSSTHETEIPLVKTSDQTTKKKLEENPIQSMENPEGLPVHTDRPVNLPPFEKSNLEKFIGENLINKIGMLITVIGVGFGVKYSIDHQLISPMTRIILGYLFSASLMVVAIRLKKNYQNFSAVLLSGSMAMLYFITFAAYSMYGLIPQWTAFLMMVAFTVFTVIAAIHYNRQVIAHIGLVGAYAVPFLLSEGSGKVGILFSYISIINIGILVISFKKYWKPLHYSSFFLTWAIYFSWYVDRYYIGDHFLLAQTFLLVYFLIFYVAFITYKLMHKEAFKYNDLFLLLSNAFIFYGLGYSQLSDHVTGSELLGLFTLGNALIHFIVSVLIYKNKLADRNLFYLVAGLVLVFITIAVPIQLNGNWVTLLWAGEATVLFWIGRSKTVRMYEYLSYPLMALAFASIFHDWSTAYDGYIPDQPETRIVPLLNINFLTSVLFIAAFGFINGLNRNKFHRNTHPDVPMDYGLLNFIAPSILLIVLYNAFRLEILSYWNQLYLDSKIMGNADNPDSPSLLYNTDLLKFKNIWVIDYSMVFLAIVSWVNIKKIKDHTLGTINIALNILAIFIFLTQGLLLLSELRETYIDPIAPEFYPQNPFGLYFRYISLGFLGMLMTALYQYFHQDFLKIKLTWAFDFILHLSLLWVISSELIHWMDLSHSAQAYKLGLTILWGVYALLLIVLGIWKNKKHLRLGAIVLFTITLAKLFLYDIAHLDTIDKTIVFVSLGVLLLIISFLYNKYKDLLIDNEPSPEHENQ